jgi:hypothetical protein
LEFHPEYLGGQIKVMMKKESVINLLLKHIGNRNNLIGKKEDIAKSMIDKEEGFINALSLVLGEVRDYDEETEDEFYERLTVMYRK